MSACRQLRQRLADLVRWADMILLSMDEPINCEMADNQIKELNDAVKVSYLSILNHHHLS
jgi:hypothetical protein